jgi:hypothetical protein
MIIVLLFFFAYKEGAYKDLSTQTEEKEKKKRGERGVVVATENNLFRAAIRSPNHKGIRRVLFDQR